MSNGTVRMIDPHGEVRDVPRAEVEAAQLAGFVAETPEAATARIDTEYKADLNSGPAAAYSAALYAAARGLTLGASDALVGAAGGGEFLADQKAAFPTLSTATEVIGSVAAAIPTGGTSLLARTPAAAVSRLGARIATTAEGASLATRAGRAVAGGAVEGGIQGVGQGVSELALSKDQLTLERAASVLLSNAARGAAIGGGVGAGAKGLEAGLGKARKALDAFAARQAPGAGGDLSTMTRAQLGIVERAEREAIEVARAPERAAIADDLALHRKELLDEKIWEATQDAKDRDLRSIGKVSLRADQQLDRLLDNPKVLASDPRKLMQAREALQQQENALEKLHAKAVAGGDAPRVPKYDEVLETGDELVTTVRPRELHDYGYSREKWEYTDAAKERARAAVAEGVPIRLAVTPKNRLAVFGEDRAMIDVALETGADLNVRWVKGPAALDGKKFGEGRARAGGGGSGGFSPRAREAADRVPAALERNRALQVRLDELAKEPMTPRLQAIADAKEARAAGGGRDTGAEDVLSAVSGVVTGGVPFLGRISQTVGRVAGRSAKTVSKVLATGERIAGSRALPPIATRTLTAVTYEPEARSKPAKRGATLPELYRARSEEVRRSTMPGPDGLPMARPEVRARIAERLKPIAAVDPIAADRIETIAARKLELLAREMPRRPDIAGMNLGGPDLWQPPDMEMRAWARLVAAVEDPEGVLERAAAGAVSTEDAKAMREVYPEMLADFTAQVLEGIPAMKERMPYARRLALSVLTGVPLDPSMDPRILRVLQGSFAAEPGSEGGTMAPRPQPNFGAMGSRRNPEGGAATPAQRRSA